MSQPRRILKPAVVNGTSPSLANRLHTLVSVLPDGAAVTLPVADLRQWIAEDGVKRVPTDADRPAEPEDRALTVTEVAELLKTKPRWVYEHALGVRRLSRRCVRFSEQSVERWLSQRS
jgi:predicted DNA-binding transcriptional regulator AlpA